MGDTILINGIIYKVQLESEVICIRHFVGKSNICMDVYFPKKQHCEKSAIIKALADLYTDELLLSLEPERNDIL